jgi:N-acetylneuraminate synthase
VNLGSIRIGKEAPPYVIAEIGSNHNGDMHLARRLVDAAVSAGAHAVKFQSWTDRSLVSRGEYERNTDYSDKKKHFGSLKEMVSAYQLTTAQHREMRDYCRERGIAFSSSPFSLEEADLLETLDVPFFKIASMDINHFQLLRHVARKQRPVLLSTGMATMGEIESAVEAIRAENNEQIVLLHCVSIYPPDNSTVNLRNMETLRRAFDVLVGFSDHTLGTAIPLAAIALGASVIEKHFTIDKNLPGWDHEISADPEEMRAIVAGGAAVFSALGASRRIVTEAELEKQKKFRRSVVARRSLSAGHTLSEADLDVKRPGTGISPAELNRVVGRRLARSVAEDDLFDWSDFA